VSHFSFCLHYYSSDLNQDSLDGAQASVSEVGSAEEFEKENTEDTPSGSHGEADGNQKKNLTTYSLCKVVKSGVAGLSRTSGEETKHDCLFIVS
jgi:hypothetical protein